MNDLLLVHILDALHKLIDVISSLNLMQSFAPLDQIRKRLILTDIKHDIYVLFVLKVSIEADNILMIQRSVNLDLAGELLSGLSSR